MPAEFMKGALISLMPTVVRAIPNVIVFQFNPETITHGWTAAPGDVPSRPQSGGDPRAARTVPGETFSFTLSLDATDMIADGSSNPVAAALAQVSGVSTRLAAIEMLQFPAADTLVGLVGSVSASAASAVYERRNSRERSIFTGADGALCIGPAADRSGAGDASYQPPRRFTTSCSIRPTPTFISRCGCSLPTSWSRSMVRCGRSRRSPTSIRRRCARFRRPPTWATPRPR